ncbi:MAG: HIT domain-containing protein [Actinobacteria bacterium]|nr:HIT domain-containing protein [Actinomycetota bacterium]MBW3646388.1 HIT domain-containing protein [Actinomycetota bacterium]
MSDCLFCRIAATEIPATVVHETSRTLAFRDIAPQAPTHVLVIPRDHHLDVGSLAAADPALLAELMTAAVAVADKEALTGGYRLLTNTGDDAGQTVSHAHVHVLGGQPLGPLG